MYEFATLGQWKHIAAFQDTAYGQDKAPFFFTVAVDLPAQARWHDIFCACTKGCCFNLINDVYRVLSRD